MTSARGCIQLEKTAKHADGASRGMTAASSSPCGRAGAARMQQSKPPLMMSFVAFVYSAAVICAQHRAYWRDRPCLICAKLLALVHHCGCVLSGVDADTLVISWHSAFALQHRPFRGRQTGQYPFIPSRWRSSFFSGPWCHCHCCWVRAAVCIHQRCVC